MLRTGLFTLIAALCAVLLPATADAAPAPGVRASYANPVRTDGHVDAAATIDRLRAMNANTYAFLVQNEADWHELEAFLPEAQTAGLTVWTYLVPPTECPGGASCAEYLPYKKDYTAWAKAIGALSLRYPVLKAWAIDDFNHNLQFFTATYTKQIRDAGRAVQPGLEFYPVVYSDAITTSFVDSYGGIIDSLIMPFRDDPHRNTLWTGGVSAQLDTLVSRLAAKNRKLILMVYASTLSATTIAPDVAYVRAVTAVGMQYTAAGKIAGVIQYALPLTPGRPQKSDESFAHTGNGGLVFTVQAKTATKAGDFAAASTTIRLDEGSSSCRMVLWHGDDRAATGPAGYHFKQAQVGGTQVWQRDVATEDTDWYTSAPIDLTSRLTGGSATLTLRLYEAKAVADYEVVARFDDVSLTGCHVADPGFESTGGWTFSRGNGAVNVGQHTYDPAYSTSVLAAVGALYAA